MLQANELRLGINLYDSLRCENIKVTEKHLRQFLISENSFLKRYKGILVNKEILLKCGFLCSGIVIGCYRIGPMIIREYKGLFYCDKNKTRVEYLHELQNLYFGIMVKLEINL